MRAGAQLLVVPTNTASYATSQVPAQEIFAELRQRLQTVAQEDAHPVIHIRGDQRAAYAPIGRIVYACQLAGIANVAFITEPEARD